MHALAGKARITRREITIYHLVCVTQRFFFFLCNEANQRLTLTRSVFVIGIIKAFFYSQKSTGACLILLLSSPNEAKPGFPLHPIKRR